MYLARYALGRLVAAAVLLSITATIVFFATQGLPGDTARAILGQNASPEQLEALRQHLGLNKSVIEQFGAWLGNIVTFNLGNSYTNGLPVSELLGPRFVASMTVALTGAVIGLTLAIGTAAYSALHRDSFIDRTVLKFGVLLAAIPDFVIAILLILAFATGGLRLLPATALIDPQASIFSQWRLLVLPSMALGLIMTPHTMYMLRATITQEMESEYASYARINGMAEWKILLCHVLPNAIAPAAQVIALGLAYLVGGVVSIEVVFGFPGFGNALVEAVRNRDLPVVQAITLFAAAAFLILTFLADMITLMATPKARPST